MFFLRLLMSVTVATLLQAQSVPKVWRSEELKGWATPIAAIAVRPGHISEELYSSIPAHNFRTYPVYHPDREPAGYWDQLQRRRPELLVDPKVTRTPQQWLEAGERVWAELGSVIHGSDNPRMIQRARSREALAKAIVETDGTIFGLRWVVAPSGVQLTTRACAGCHTARRSDGSMVVGAPNTPGFSSAGIVAALDAEGIERLFPDDSPARRMYRLFGVPWLKDDVHGPLLSANPPDLKGTTGIAGVEGTFVRHNSSPYFTTKIPDLIGIKDRKYLDATGTHKHRGIGDLMRYAALVAGADSFEFGEHRLLQESKGAPWARYDDAVLYALATFIYSLQPPSNPNHLNDLSKRGGAVFNREGCSGCHTPPLFTNNKLTIAKGYTPPANHPNREDILMVSVGTDPGLALRTRKGTGFYRVPSLRNISYRQLLLHDGSIRGLEEMFNPARLRDDYEPKGWRPPGSSRRAIKGHEFGLKLPIDERNALIAYLRTL